MDRRTFTKAAPMLALSAAAPAAFAQEYPSKPIKLVVGYPPGGANDILARLVATKLGEMLSTQIVVDNKAGANGVIGNDIVAKSAPDGYTLLAAGMTPMVLNRLTYKKLPYNPATDFVGVGTVASSPMIFAVRNTLNVRNLADLIKLAKAQPGVLNFATVGSGGSTRVVFELFRQTTGVDVRWVPYKGAAPAITDILGGTMDGMAIDFPALYPFVKDGRMTAIAITSEARHPLLPELRTATEQGIPELTCGNWYAISAPAKTPPAVVQKLRAELQKMAQSSDFKQQLIAQGAEAKSSASAQAYESFVQAELARWDKVIKAAGIEAE